MHSLKIYAIKGISISNVEIDCDVIPKDLHELLKPFIKFFKIGEIKMFTYNCYNSNDFITNFENKKDDLLFLSSFFGLIEVVKYLVEHKANVNAYNGIALKWAAIEGYLEIVKYLVKNGANIQLITNDDDIIKWASRNYHRQVVKYLIENGANVAALSMKYTKWNARYGRFEVAKYYNCLLYK